MNTFVDFDEFLTGAYAKHFKTYDNSRQSDLISVENCLDMCQVESNSSIDHLNQRLGQVNRRPLNRCSSKGVQGNENCKLAHACSQVSARTGKKLPQKVIPKPGTLSWVVNPTDSKKQKTLIEEKLKEGLGSKVNTVHAAKSTFIRQQIDKLISYTMAKKCQTKPHK